MEFGNVPHKTIGREIEIPIRVRYCETDQMGVVHHTHYFRYFEVARMEHFRTLGYPYNEMEQNGTLLMIIDMQCKCRFPAYFDEIIFVKAWIQRITRLRIVHQYEVRNKDEQIIATGKTVLVPVSKEGFPVPLPESLWSELKGFGA